MVNALQGSNAASIQRQLEHAAKKPLEQFQPKDKAAALLNVAKDLGIKPVDLLNALEDIFPSTFSEPPAGLENLGAQNEYRGAAEQRSIGCSPVGTRIKAMRGHSETNNLADSAGIAREPSRVKTGDDIRAERSKRAGEIQPSSTPEPTITSWDPSRVKTGDDIRAERAKRDEGKQPPLYLYPLDHVAKFGG